MSKCSRNLGTVIFYADVRADQMQDILLHDTAYHIFFIHLAATRSCFHILTVENNAVLNIADTDIFSRYYSEVEQLD